MNRELWTRKIQRNRSGQLCFSRSPWVTISCRRPTLSPPASLDRLEVELPPEHLAAAREAAAAATLEELERTARRSV